MAKKAKKKAVAKKARRAAPSPTQLAGATPPGVLRSLLKHGRDTKSDVQGLTGEFGQAVKSAVEDKHLHRKAFSIVRQLDAMTDEKLAECMAHLEFYLDAADINGRVERVGRLDLGDEPHTEDEAEEVVPGNDNPAQEDRVEAAE